MNFNECLHCMRDMQMNCAEISLTALNEEYDLGVSRDAIRVMAGFGGGICGDMCGTLCGSLAALGQYHVYSYSHASGGFIDSCREFVRLFEEEMGDKTCSGLMKKYHTETEGCAETVVRALALFRKYREIEARERPQYVFFHATPENLQRAAEMHREQPLAELLFLEERPSVPLEGTAAESLDMQHKAPGIEIRPNSQILAADEARQRLTVRDMTTGETYNQRYDTLAEQL